MNKYIIKGLLILESNPNNPKDDESRDIYTSNVYQNHKDTIDKLIEWANRTNAALLFGGTEDNYYVCEYAFDGLTKPYLKGLVSELKAMLKPDFPQIKENHQVMFERRGE